MTAGRDYPIAAERLSEIAEILAAGFTRVLGRKSSPFSPEPGEVRSTTRRPGAVIRTRNLGEFRMADTVLAQLAALKSAPVGTLKQRWRDLFQTEPPPYNRRFLENRLAYRIQELAYD